MALIIYIEAGEFELIESEEKQEMHSISHFLLSLQEL